MPRHSYKKRPVKKDKLFNSLEVAKLINYIMINGKKSVAEGIVYKVFAELKKQSDEPLKLLPNKEFHTFDKKLLVEIVEAAKNQGPAVAKRQQTEKLADANKAFSHLKW